jgi:hypothetical protein
MRAIAEHRLQRIASARLPCPAKPVGRWKCAPARAPWLCGAHFDQSGCPWTPGRADYDVENRLAAHIRDRDRNRRFVS